MKKISDAVLDKFRTVLRNEDVVTDEKLCESYGHDWTHLKGKASVILFPRSTQEVSGILKICNSEKISVIPSGGRTGLAGAAVATESEVVLSLEKMNKILEIDTIGMSVTAEAGVIIQALQEKIREAGFFYPVDLASKGSCQLGGNIATNAGGLKLIRYGGTREHVLGLEVVLANGDICDLNFNLKKDNSGYDLKNLFVTSEGTLGVITKATMRIMPKPKELKLVVMTLNQFSGILEVLRLANMSGLQLTAFEFFTRQALDIVLKHHKEIRDPFQNSYANYVLIEYEQISSLADAQMQELLEEAMEKGWVQDALIATNSAEFRQFWGMRENISESVAVEAMVRKNDITIPIAKLADFDREAQKIIQSAPKDIRLVLFGHIGDGNIHINYLGPKDGDREKFLSDVHKLEEKVFTIIKGMRGSISAEHGIGLIKKEDLKQTRTPAQIEMMRQIKKIFDPNGILNPGKIFD